jgi:hypothetical protein
MLEKCKTKKTNASQCIWQMGNLLL